MKDPPTESQKPNEQKGGQLTKQKRLKDTTSQEGEKNLTQWFLGYSKDLKAINFISHYDSSEDSVRGKEYKINCRLMGIFKMEIFLDIIIKLCELSSLLTELRSCYSKIWHLGILKF